jgi:hypothetical protein
MVFGGVGCGGVQDGVVLFSGCSATRCGGLTNGAGGVGCVGIDVSVVFCGDPGCDGDVSGL